jgi:DNA-binding SARP family transcriptional activator
MDTLRISLIGIVRVNHEGLPAREGIGRAVKALLGYLTLFRHRLHTREVLAGLFWGDSSESKARSCLSTTLWRLRKILEPDGIPTGTYLVTTPMGEIGFNQKSSHWIDVAILETEVKDILSKSYSSLSPKEVHRLGDALKLYRGELLEGIYNEWALRERERIRSLYLKGQYQLLQYHNYHNQYDQGLSCAKTILNIDPLREEVHREIMRFYFKKGQRALALRQYEKCYQTLASELGVTPMEETQLLYARIRQGVYPSRAAFSESADNHAAHMVLSQLYESIHNLEKTAQALKRSVKNFEAVIRKKD